MENEDILFLMWISFVLRKKREREGKSVGAVGKGKIKVGGG